MYQIRNTVTGELSPILTDAQYALGGQYAERKQKHKTDADGNLLYYMTVERPRKKYDMSLVDELVEIPYSEGEQVQYETVQVETTAAGYDVPIIDTWTENSNILTQHNDFVAYPPVMVDDGPLYEWVEIVPSLTELQDAKWLEIKQAREQAKYQPLSYLGKVFDFNSEAQNNINGAVQAAQSAMIAGVTLPVITWTLADNTSFDLTAEQLIAIPFAGVTRNGEIYAKARLLREQIYAATTAEQVAEIKWD